MRALVLSFCALFVTTACSEEWEVEAKLAEYEGAIISVDSCICKPAAFAEATTAFGAGAVDPLCDVDAYESRLAAIEEGLATKAKFGVHVRNMSSSGWIEDLFFFDGDDGVVYNKAWDCLQGPCRDRRGWAHRDASHPAVERMSRPHSNCDGDRSESFGLSFSSDGDHSHIPHL